MNAAMRRTDPVTCTVLAKSSQALMKGRQVASLAGSEQICKRACLVTTYPMKISNNSHTDTEAHRSDSKPDPDFRQDFSSVFGGLTANRPDSQPGIGREREGIFAPPKIAIVTML
ncbi:hypothetical protein [Methylorubrum populi]|uniref:hypothetical protein n=1 Tax=Methylorubrum populi TaxID=223967 RepID=UPI003F65B93A